MTLPQGWVETSLDTIIEPSAPICYGVLKPGEPSPGGIRMVRVTDIRTNELDETDLLLISKDLDSEFGRSRITAGDLLISVQGTVGKVAVVPATFMGGNISRTIARIRTSDAVEPRWLWRALLSPQFQSAALSETGGTTRDSLNIGALRELLIHLPPLAEQRRIASKLDVLTGHILRARSELGKVAALTGSEKRMKLVDRLAASILAKAYRGELVLQNPADESAAALLDRIRAEREGAPKTKRGRRGNAGGHTVAAAARHVLPG